MADKLLVVTTFIVLTLPAVEVTNHIPLWLTVLLISRDVVIVGVVAVVNLAVGPRTFRPSVLGKAATATYMLVSLAFLYSNWQQERSVAIDIAVYAALVLTIVSSLDYFIRMRRLINEGH